MRKRLTDKSIAALRRKSARYEVQDDRAPGLAVRVSERGTKSFIMIARFPGSHNPVRRTLGEYGAMTLERARDMTREWHALIKRSVDPAHEMARQRRDAARQRSSTFAAVVEDYLAAKAPDQRRAREAERLIRYDLLPVLGDRPIGDISAADVAGLIKTIRKRSQYGARNALIYTSSIFKWALSQHCYPLIANPAAGLDRENLIGKLKSRARLLSEVELFAMWRAAERMPYPFGPLVRMLMLCGQRHADVAEATWDEFNFERREWIIPAARFKGDRDQLVPLTDQMVTELPRFSRGSYLFSTTGGEKPTLFANFYSRRLAARMLRTLKALARHRGDDPAKVELPPFVMHDLRRAIRSTLPRLRVLTEISERVIGHAQPVLIGTYDKYAYADEKRAALQRWADHIEGLVTGKAEDNVVRLARK